MPNFNEIGPVVWISIADTHSTHIDFYILEGQSGKRVGGARVCALYYLPHCHMKQGCQMVKYPTGYLQY